MTQVPTTARHGPRRRREWQWRVLAARPADYKLAVNDALLEMIVSLEQPRESGCRERPRRPLGSQDAGAEALACASRRFVESTPYRGATVCWLSMNESMSRGTSWTPSRCPPSHGHRRITGQGWRESARSSSDSSGHAGRETGASSPCSRPRSTSDYSRAPAIRDSWRSSTKSWAPSVDASMPRSCSRSRRAGTCGATWPWHATRRCARATWPRSSTPSASTGDESGSWPRNECGYRRWPATSGRPEAARPAGPPHSGDTPRAGPRGSSGRLLACPQHGPSRGHRGPSRHMDDWLHAIRRGLGEGPSCRCVAIDT